MMQKWDKVRAVARPRYLAALALLGIGSQGAFALGPGEIFVANYLQNSVVVYSRTASGAATPKRTIQTGLTNPFGVLVDQLHGEIFVANNTNGTARVGSVQVYDMNANFPNDVPKRTIAGNATNLMASTGLALDILRDELYVVNDDTSTITVFPRTANGNVAPKRMVQGAATNLAGPLGVYVDLLHDELIVVNKVTFPGGPGWITVYPRAASGNVTPIRMIAGSQTGFNVPVGMDLDVLRDEIVVANSFSNSVLFFHRTDNGNVAPIRMLAGPDTQLCQPYGVAVDLLNNQIVVANSGYQMSSCGASTTTYPRLSSGDQTPTRAFGLGSFPASYPVALSETPLSLN